MKTNTTVRVLALLAATVTNLAIATGLHLLAAGEQAMPTMAGDPLPQGERLAGQAAHGG